MASFQALVAVLPGGGRLPPNLGDPLLANLLACLRLQSFDRDLERESLGMLAVHRLRESCPQLDWKEQARVVREMPLDPEMKPVVERLLAIMNQMHASKVCLAELFRNAWGNRSGQAHAHGTTAAAAM